MGLIAQENVSAFIHCESIKFNLTQISIYNSQRYLHQSHGYDGVLISFCWFQEVANRLAKLALRACARLGGYLAGQLESPNNAVTQEILNRLLTPYLARQLSLDKPEEVSQAQRKVLLNLTYCVSLHNSYALIFCCGSRK
jgi:hypothetical protein